MAISSTTLDTILAADLTYLQKALWLAVRSREGRDQEPVQMPRKALAEAIGSTKAGVIRAVSEMIETGWLEESEKGLLALLPETSGGDKKSPPPGDKKSPLVVIKSHHPGDKKSPPGDEKSPPQTDEDLIERVIKIIPSIDTSLSGDGFGEREKENSDSAIPIFDLSMTPYEIYLQLPGAVRNNTWKDKIDTTVGTSDEAKAQWMETCLTWATSKSAQTGEPWKASRVPDMITHFKKQIHANTPLGSTPPYRAGNPNGAAPKRTGGTASERAGRISTQTGIDECYEALAIVRARRS
jgi:hypothetical protein